MIRYQPQSIQDVRSVASYFEEAAGLNLSNRFVDAFQQTCSFLEHSPGIGSPLSRSTYRRFRVDGFERYLIYYREIESGVLIVRVLHGMRHLPSILAE
ncbi:MAG: type II toxin-antitoxin system RelE/ParE family toxin [Acidobacteriaceae bacterium]|nr:type II toxin-antitoxin system RelE/ParE family toxin [Acidobacteriaceae bacterium]